MLEAPHVFDFRQDIGNSSNETLYVVLLHSAPTEELMASLPLEAFCNSNIWLLFDEEKRLQAATQIHFPIDSQVFTFRQESSARIVVEEMYQVSQNSKTLVLPYASWTLGEDLLVTPVPLEERRKDLQGLVLRGQTLPELPYASVEVKNNLVHHIGGIIGEIWHGVLGLLLIHAPRILGF